MRSSLLDSVIMAEFQATETCSSLDLTRAKYSVNILIKVGKENVIVRISPSNFSACGNGNSLEDENEVCTQYAHPNP
jgi:hypothetical protein